jgi:hypothetical protein
MVMPNTIQAKTTIVSKMLVQAGSDGDWLREGELIGGVGISFVSSINFVPLNVALILA